MKDLCVLVSSSDNTFDIFSIVGNSVVKEWPTDEIQMYVGLNQCLASQPFLGLYSKEAKNWSSELKVQINKLPSKYENIVLILDDFYFTDKVNLHLLQKSLDFFKQNNADYLRLKPIKRSWIVETLYSLRLNKKFAVKLGKDEPYYSSLQVAIWKRPYLCSMLEECKSIWDFEHYALPGSRHYAVSLDFVKYIHLVEKGKWFKYAPKMLKNTHIKFFLKRGFVSSPFKNSRLFNKIKFGIFGYFSFRIKKWIHGFAINK